MSSLGKRIKGVSRRGLSKPALSYHNTFTACRATIKADPLSFFRHGKLIMVLWVETRDPYLR